MCRIRYRLLYISFFVLFCVLPTYSQRVGWGDINYTGAPWVENVSQPYRVSQGLQNRHLAINASHGKFYDQSRGYWRWQRPNLFGTTEDLYTQTIVVPLLIPMLENAGAVVYSSRERDWQKAEVTIDNDVSAGTQYYQETSSRKHVWADAPLPGFSYHSGSYRDGENPFTAGTARQCIVSKGSATSSIRFMPDIPQSGRYAVYVSYQTVERSIDDAEYIVRHNGAETRFKVNQRMGGGTWVYLGSFEFAAGCSENNCVILTNMSRHSDGLVTSDAVRFGGGMGNVERGGRVSGMPRCLEGARYSAQWAGAPYSVYSFKSGSDDYRDDINTRSAMTNWLAGGSVYVPNAEGKKVPIELSLAVHSDAGYDKAYTALVGTLSICTTNHNNGLLNAGVSRNMSRTFADMLLENTHNDIVAEFGTWAKRVVYDRNYSESRVPMVPSAIIETLSHQSFPDMMMGQDPNFKFTLARSIYKTILKYVAAQHNERYVVTPLTPDHFSVSVSKNGKAELRWRKVSDRHENSAEPDAYRLYIAQGNNDWDNGQMVKHTSAAVNLKPGVLYRFRVSAVNDGGESFPSEELTAVYHPNARRTILVVNGFHRLSSPAVINTEALQGFDLESDIGVWAGYTAGWNGPQTDFDKRTIGVEGPGGLGYGSDAYVGRFLAGNTFNYPTEHARLMQHVSDINVSSCSVEALINGTIKTKGFDALDIILGLERDDGRSLKRYKSFPSGLQRVLRDFCRHGGNLLVSGAYIGCDMISSEDAAFVREVLKANYKVTLPTNDWNTLEGLGGRYTFHNKPNEQHYAQQSADVLEASDGAFTPLIYHSGYSAAVAYSGKDYRSFVMGVPLECITERTGRERVMKAILSFLIP